MAMGIYKAGQGYWTRMMTAIGIGTMALLGGVWLGDQLKAARLPLEDVILQGIVISISMIGAAALVYWVVGLNRKSVDFFIATESEMQKVNWSTRKEVMGSTWVVIGVSLCIAIVLLLTDLVFAKFFQWINVLER